MLNKAIASCIAAAVLIGSAFMVEIGVLRAVIRMHADSPRQGLPFGLWVDLGYWGPAILSLIGVGAFCVATFSQWGKRHAWARGAVLFLTIGTLNGGVIFSLLPWFFIGHKVVQ